MVRAMATARKTAHVTAPQLVVLRRILASQAGYIMRMPGGFWTTPETTLSSRALPSWYAATQTIASCERAGLLGRAHAYDEPWRDHRRLTLIGEGLARTAQIPALTPAMRRNLADFAQGRGHDFYAPDLDTLGYVEKHGDGYRITADGIAALARTRP
jgi:hypothetical protein